MKHKHRFVAIPFTGQNAWNGKEALFGYRLECEQCHKKPKAGDAVVEVKASSWKEIYPVPMAINHILTDQEVI